MSEDEKRLQKKLKVRASKKQKQNEKLGKLLPLSDPTFEITDNRKEVKVKTGSKEGIHMTRKEQKKIKKVEELVKAQEEEKEEEKNRSNDWKEHNKDGSEESNGSDSEDDVPMLIDTATLEDDISSDSDIEIDYTRSSMKVTSTTTEADNNESEGEGIPLEDLLSESDAENSNEDDEDDDAIPYQKLKVNNVKALASSLSKFEFPYKKMTFSEHMSVTSAEPTDIEDVNNDLARELSFYNQALDAAYRGRSSLAKENISFSRPGDYFAEMVKTDAHMTRLSNKMLEEASQKKAAEEARRQRDLKKFGKQVQVAKLQKRSKEKRATLDKIKNLKKSKWKCLCK